MRIEKSLLIFLHNNGVNMAYLLAGTTSTTQFFFLRINILQHLSAFLFKNGMPGICSQNRLIRSKRLFYRIQSCNIYKEEKINN